MLTLLDPKQSMAHYKDYAKWLLNIYWDAIDEDWNSRCDKESDMLSGYYALKWILIYIAVCAVIKKLIGWAVVLFNINCNWHKMHVRWSDIGHTILKEYLFIQFAR